MPEPKLRWLFSRGCASPKNREKNSSIGSLEPLRGDRCAVVEMFTTTGIVFFCIGGNERRPIVKGCRVAGFYHRKAQSIIAKGPQDQPCDSRTVQPAE